MKNITLLIIFIFFNLYLNAQTSNGCFNKDTLIRYLPEYKESIKRIDTYYKIYEDSLKKIQTDYYLYLESNFICVDYSMDSTLKVKMMDTLNKLNNRINVYQNYALKKLDNYKENENMCIDTLLSVEIKEFCSKNKIALLVDKNTLPVDTDCIDYTNEIILFFRKKKI